MDKWRVMLRDWLLKPSADELAETARQQAEWERMYAEGRDAASLCEARLLGALSEGLDRRALN